VEVSHALERFFLALVEQFLHVLLSYAWKKFELVEPN